MIRVPHELLGPDLSRELEWVEPDGLGGFAMGSAAFLPTRRYHALLTVARTPPVDRRTLVKGLIERVYDGDQEWRLDAADRLRGEDGGGHRHLVEVELDPLLRFRYQLGPHVVERVVVVPRGHRLVIVSYRQVEGPGPLRMVVTPLLAGRFYHDLILANPIADPTPATIDGGIRFRPYEDELPVHLYGGSAVFTPSPRWEHGFLYDRERRRGYQYREDLLCPGELEVPLPAGRQQRLILSADPLEDPDPVRLEQEERDRRRALAEAAAGTGRHGPILALAADRFRIRRGEEEASVLAGYPWFEDWGRDTFLSLPGLSPGAGKDFPARVLGAFARHEDRGLIPNRFGDAPGETLYNAADAPLWYVLALGRLLRAPKRDPELLEPLWSTAERIFEGYLRGTRHGIGVDPADGLVTAGEEGLQLTWMDAKVGDQVVTPRAGKPVEIQGLWMNTCSVIRDEARRRALPDLEERARTALDAARETFHARYWIDTYGYYADCLTPGGNQDTSLRPNQLIPLSLRYCPVDRRAALRVLERVEKELVTPWGLRTLAPSDPRYRGRYEGDIVSRDEAYHQGTVWPWLLGPYGRACLRFRGDKDRPRLRKLLRPLLSFLEERGLGNLPEVFDGAPPHHPGGCPAQAWSVAEVRQLYRLIEQDDPYDPTDH